MIRQRVGPANVDHKRNGCYLAAGIAPRPGKDACPVPISRCGIRTVFHAVAQSVGDLVPVRSRDPAFIIYK